MLTYTGALGLPDIGQLFPDNDPELSGADSSVFMEEAYRRMEARGFRVGNVDVTLILQKPKVYLAFFFEHEQDVKRPVYPRLSCCVECLLFAQSVKFLFHGGIIHQCADRHGPLADLAPLTNFKRTRVRSTVLRVLTSGELGTLLYSAKVPIHPYFS